jgi:hypothetical protein
MTNPNATEADITSDQEQLLPEGSVEILGEIFRFLLSIEEENEGTV